MLTKILVENYLKRTDSIVDVEAPVWKAWRLIKGKELKTLPVVKGGKVVGLVSDRDIVQISGYNGGQSMPVKEAMSLNPLIVNHDADVKTVLQSMLMKDQQIAVVVDSQSKVIGLFSWSCALKFMLNFMDKNNLKEVI